MKITRYADIPEFTRDANWAADYSPDSAVHTVRKWVVESGLNLNPDFQRAHVWTEAQQIAWMEFFLRGGKSGRSIFFNHPGWMRSWRGDFVVVDGKQRLHALMRFFDNEIPAFGTLHDDFKDRQRISGATIRLHVNTLQTRAEVLQWYIEFNAGGTPHTDDEIEKVRRLLEAEKARVR